MSVAFYCLNLSRIYRQTECKLLLNKNPRHFIFIYSALKKMQHLHLSFIFVCNFDFYHAFSCKFFSLARHIVTSACEHVSLWPGSCPPCWCQLGTMVMTNGDSNTAYKLGSSSTNWCLLFPYWPLYSHFSSVIGCCYLSQAGLDFWWSHGELAWVIIWDTGHWWHVGQAENTT